jgi:disulfide bond formation protein DsbB
MFQFNNSNRRPIWYLAIALPLVLEPAALIFQYALDYGPCILCVQIRATLFAMLITGIAGIAVSCKKAQKLLSSTLLAITAVFAYQSVMVLGIERYWFEGSCTMDAPFPSWLPLNDWLPSVFEPWELCGYTPEIIHGITMAETLVVISITSLLIAIFNLFVVLRK